jgi:hypothetical protein
VLSAFGEPHAVIEPSALRAAKAIPLPLLRPMVQSRRGVPHIMEA